MKNKNNRFKKFSDNELELMLIMLDRKKLPGKYTEEQYGICCNLQYEVHDEISKRTKLK